MVSLFVEEVPVFTLPKLRLDELKESVFVDATPVPLRATVDGEFGALLTILTVPLREPAVVGANTPLKVTLLPAATVLGSVIPLTENPAALMLTWEIVKEAAPVFVIVKV
jgi:hypothetical protein